MFELEMPHGKEKSFISREFPNNGNPAFGFSRFSYWMIIISGLIYQSQKSQRNRPRSNVKNKNIQTLKSKLEHCVVAHEPQGSPTCLADAILGQRENCEQTTLQWCLSQRITHLVGLHSLF